MTKAIVTSTRSHHPRTSGKVMLFCCIMSSATAFQSLAGKSMSSVPCVSSSLSYSSLADPPLDSTPRSRSFLERMRETVTQQQSKEATTHKSHVREVSTLQDFRNVIVTGSHKNQIVAVQWYAPWCRACKVLQPAFDSLNRKFSKVQYVAVPSHKADGNLHVGFGITSVPYGHIYHPTAGLVEELKLNPKTFQKTYVRILKSYLDGQCDLPNDVDSDTGIYSSPYERIS